LAPWRRAPHRLWRTPSLFVAVAVAAVVLGMAGGSRPLLASSAGNAALAQGIDEGCAWQMGLRVERLVPGPDLPRSLRERSAALDRAVAGAEGVDPAVTVGPQHARAISGADPTLSSGVQLLSRTGADDHIDIVDSVAAPGVLMPDQTAAAIGVAAGHDVVVQIEGVDAVVPVRAVFRDLARTERDPFWCSSERLIDDFQNRSPPPTILADEAFLLDLLVGAGIQRVPAAWEYGPRSGEWTLDRARAAAGALETVSSETNNPSEDLGVLLGPGRSSVDRQLALPFAEGASATASAAAGPVALGTVAVALLIVIVAAQAWLDRRHQELTILAMRGAGPASLAVKGTVEMATPVILGAVVGVALGFAAVRELGPGRTIERAAAWSAVALVAIAVAVALATVTVVVLSGTRSVGIGSSHRGTRAMFVWEPVVLVAAAAAYYELHTRGPSQSGAGEAQVDSLVLLFPVLLLLGGSGLFARFVLTGPFLRRVAARLPTAGWLSARRLAASWFRAVPVVTSVAVSVGIVVFAGSLGSSLEATIQAKARLGPGSQQVVDLLHPAPLPPDAPLSEVSTEVVRTDDSSVTVRGHEPSDVLGVDPATFERAAYWDASFADRSLNGLLDELSATRRGGDVPAVAVGAGLPERFSLRLDGDDGAVDVPVKVVERATAFPGYGYQRDRPLVVVDRAALTELGVTRSAEVWVDSDAPDVGELLTAAGLPVRNVLRSDNLVQGDLIAQSWTLDYIRVMGLAAASIPVCALGLYFSATAERRRLGTALMLEMGVPHRTSTAATAAEIGAMLATGLAVGVAAAWAAIRLVFDYLDPRPGTPPPALFRYDAASVVVAAGAILVITLAVTVVIDRWSSRSSLPELLRRAS
jgi:hypothetical protein